MHRREDRRRDDSGSHRFSPPVRGIKGRVIGRDVGVRTLGAKGASHRSVGARGRRVRRVGGSGCVGDAAIRAASTGR